MFKFLITGITHICTRNHINKNAQSVEVLHVNDGYSGDQIVLRDLTRSKSICQRNMSTIIHF